MTDFARPELPIVSSGDLSTWLTNVEVAGDGVPVAEDFGDQVLIERAFAALRDAHTQDGVFSAADSRLASLIQTLIATDPEVFGASIIEGDQTKEAKFDNHDYAGYFRALVPFVRQWLGFPRRDPRPPPADTPHTLSPKARIAVFGDWGTDMYGARDVSAQITAGDHDAVVHLGDTYYSGAENEIKERLLRHFPTVKPGAVRRVCSSNHEMYSGGKPFYDLALPACEQASTVFTLQNEDWLFVGLDTGFEDGRIDDDQQKWLKGVLSDLGNRRLVLLGHHHPWSNEKKPNPELVADLKPAFDAGVFAWYWGHVHACEIYEPKAFPKTKTAALRGRCVGHSGYPYFRDDFSAAASIDTPRSEIKLRKVPPNGTKPAALVLDGPNEYLGADRDRYGPNGFMRLELDGKSLREQLVHSDGTVLWQNVIS